MYKRGALCDDDGKAKPVCILSSLRHAFHLPRKDDTTIPIAINIDSLPGITTNDVYPQCVFDKICKYEALERRMVPHVLIQQKCLKQRQQSRGFALEATGVTAAYLKKKNVSCANTKAMHIDFC